SCEIKWRQCMKTSDAEFARPMTRDGARGGFRPRRLIEKLAGMWEKAAPLHCQFDAPCVASLEQAEPQSFLELVERLGNGRLGDVEHPRCLADTAIVGGSDEVGALAEREGHHIKLGF